MTAPDSLHVLLVEDSAGERWLMAEILRSRGHMVTACEGSKEALEAWRSDRHPLCVLDWVLEEGSGIELCRQIRAEPEGDRPVILVVTGRNDPSALADVLAVGGDDYVAKPYDVALLNVRLAVAESRVRSQAERAKAEAALDRVTAEIQELFRNLGDVIFSVDLESDRALQISAAVEAVFGKPATAFLAPGRWSALLPGHEPDAIRARLAEVEGDRSLVLTLSQETEDGAIQWLEASLRPRRGAEGRIVRFDGVIADVSERERNQLELAARNRELHTLHQISETTLASESLEEGLRDIVEIICRDTGFPMATVEWKGDDERTLRLVAARGTLPESLSREPSTALDNTLTGNAFHSGTSQILKNAAQRPHMVQPILRKVGYGTLLAFPIQTPSERVGVLTLAHTDVLTPDSRMLHWGSSLANYLATFAERRKAVEALRESDAKHRRLAEELQSANRELEAFGYSVSHDLSAPLRTMQGFAHTLLDRFGKTLDPTAADFARRILASGEQAERLIQDLLAYSKLTLQQFQPAPVRLSEVVAAAIAQLDVDIRSSGAQIDVPKVLPVVLGHHTTLVQVIANLLSNAMKFARGGVPPQVRIHSESVEGQVRLWVEDNGIGIPSEHTERIFRTFERLTQTQARPGTGIGLAIVRRGMERIGGSAGVEPRTGHGSRFWIQVPGRPND